MEFFQTNKHIQNCLFVQELTEGSGTSGLPDKTAQDRKWILLEGSRILKHSGQEGFWGDKTLFACLSIGQEREPLNS